MQPHVDTMSIAGQIALQGCQLLTASRLEVAYHEDVASMKLGRIQTHTQHLTPTLYSTRQQQHPRLQHPHTTPTSNSHV